MKNRTCIESMAKISYYNSLMIKAYDHKQNEARNKNYLKYNQKILKVSRRMLQRFLKNKLSDLKITKLT